MSNPYPVEIADPGDGVVKAAGNLTFTDPANQPGGGSQTVTAVTVPVSSAQLKDLLAHPVTLVAAPGTDKTLVPLACFVYYVFNTTAYTLPDADILWLTLGNLFQADIHAVFDNTQDDGLLVTGAQPPDPATFPGSVFDTSFVNTPLLLQNFGGGDLTLGDGTLAITVYYATLDTP